MAPKRVRSVCVSLEDGRRRTDAFGRNFKGIYSKMGVVVGVLVVAVDTHTHRWKLQIDQISRIRSASKSIFLPPPTFSPPDQNGNQEEEGGKKL